MRSSLSDWMLFWCCIPFSSQCQWSYPFFEPKIGFVRLVRAASFFRVPVSRFASGHADPGIGIRPA
jgi:hypothetical protein